MSLALQAQALASKLGHKLDRWQPNPDYPRVQFALCRRCSYPARLDAAPMLPRLALTGDAVEIPCPAFVKRYIRRLVPPAPAYRYFNRAQVFDRDKGICASCGLDTHALFTELASLSGAAYSMRFVALVKAGWPPDRLKDMTLWDGNHKVAVAEQGGRLGIENIETLCIPCHRKHSAALARRLALRRDYESRLVGELLTQLSRR